MIDYDTRFLFLSGGCASFALVLAERLLQAGVDAKLAVLSDDSGEPWSRQHPFEFTHVAVSTPSGYIDVMGFEHNAAALMRKTFGDISLSVQDDMTVDEIRALVGRGKRFPLAPASSAESALIGQILEADDTVTIEVLRERGALSVRQSAA